MLMLFPYRNISAKEIFVKVLLCDGQGTHWLGVIRAKAGHAGARARLAGSFVKIKRY
jgi:hypothetical protein